MCRSIQNTHMNIYFHQNMLRYLGILAGAGALLIGVATADAQAQTNDSDSAIQLAQNQERRRVAVLDFDFSSISSPDLLAAFPGIARGTSELLTNQLVNEGSFSVVERSRIQKILDEQDLGEAGRLDASTAAQIGRVLGVDAVIVGSVTQFDVQEERSGFSIGGLFGERKRTMTADVQLNARMINTNTGEIISTAEGTGQAEQRDGSTQVLGVGGGSETDNRQQLLSEATRQAVAAITNQLTNSSGDVAAVGSGPEAALIADITGDTVVLNRGTANGYRQGMQVAVERVAREIKDPETGEVIRQVTEQIGLIELTDVDQSSSLGRILSGSNFQVGDTAKPVQ
ncbi:MAG: CsgG/HfaB family protein [Cyanophyceae cyanobacterium]